MSLVHLVQGFNKDTEALEWEHVIPLELVASVREALGEPEDPNEDPGVLPLSEELIPHVERLTGFRLDTVQYEWFLDVAQADFAISVEEAVAPHGLNDPSFGKISISIAGTDITTWQHFNGNTGAGIDIPLYGAAEWVAQNWWALLYEPHKGESDAAGYRRRHWLGTARGSWALPDLWISPAGGRIEVHAKRCTVAHARTRFTNGASSSIDRVATRDQLYGFVETVLNRMENSGENNTLAHRLWNLVRGTTPEQEAYCRLIGAMGLSPYVDNGVINDTVERLSQHYDSNLVLDLCQAADEGSLAHAADIVQGLDQALDNSAAIDFSRLGKLTISADVPARPWQRGVSAAIRMRESLDVSPLDPRSAISILDILNVATNSAIVLPHSVDDESRISAAIRRTSQPDVHIALAGLTEPQLRFAAARSMFFALLSSDESSRLATTAKTRDQKASRSFAAEIVVPFSFIKMRNDGRPTISTGLIEDIAEEVVCLPKTVHFQARNNGLRIVN